MELEITQNFTVLQSVTVYFGVRYVPCSMSLGVTQLSVDVFGVTVTNVDI